MIAQRIDESAQDPWIRSVALELVRGTPQHGPEMEEAEVQRIFWFVKNNIEYRGDPRDRDLYASARRTLTVRGGDCDCHSVLVDSLLTNLGYLVGAKVISPDNQAWHIYPVVGIHSKEQPSVYVALDTTQTEAFPGWEPDPYYRKHEILATFKGGRVVAQKRMA